MKQRWFISGFGAAALTALVATTGWGQALNTGPVGDTTDAYPGEPLGGVDRQWDDEDSVPPQVPAPTASAKPAPAAGKSAPEDLTYGVEWADHVSPSFRRWVKTGSGPEPAPVQAEKWSAERPAAQAAGTPPNGQPYGVQWAEHVSPSFRRWISGDTTPPPRDLGPLARNRPGPAQMYSDLSTIENAVDKPSPPPADKAGVDGTAILIQRASRGHAYDLVAPEGSTMGAELVAGVISVPPERSATWGTIFDRIPERGADPKRFEGPLPGSGPLQTIPVAQTYDGGPIFGAPEPFERPPRTYAVALSRNSFMGAMLNNGVYVVSVTQFAKGDVPQPGEFVVYPRSDFRPFGAINSFEDLNPYRDVNVGPLQLASDSSSPSPVDRSLYSMNNYGPWGYANVPLSDRWPYEVRQMLIDRERDPRRCCGPNQIIITHNPLALIVLPNPYDSTPGATYGFVPLAPGMPAW
ncbi:MAG: hypothetical protein GC201_12095 [Alphaproteobacteria bacterium]|nr:hypothetical protein [Alphaproteobacteria bacterium]